MFKALFFFLAGTAPLPAQIYADFKVSHGETSLGTFRALLEHERAPRTCANFIGLATGKRPWIDLANGSTRTNTPFYDGLTFHRLDHNFVIQGGSRNGLGNDGPGFTILDEYHPQLRHDSEYVLSMAKAGFPNTGGSQFFITLAAAAVLDDKHSVFGTVIEGTGLIDRFKNPQLFPTGPNERPQTPIVINSVTVTGIDAESFDINSPTLRLPHVSKTSLSIKRDAVASSMTAVFNRKPQTAYLTFGSPDLLAWSRVKATLSIDAEVGYQLPVYSRPEPRYFLHTASVDYGQIPNAPSDLNRAGTTLRIFFRSGAFIDISPDGSGGGTWEESSNRAGTLAGTSWVDLAPGSGVIPDSTETYLISIGDYQTTLQNYPSNGSSFTFKTWLSFHSPTRGWTEESNGIPGNRFPFEILSR